MKKHYYELIRYIKRKLFRFTYMPNSNRSSMLVLNNRSFPTVSFYNSSRYERYEVLRLKGPAIIYSDGRVSYYQRGGKLHRTDGPAVIWSDGSKWYYVNDKKIEPAEFFLKYGVL